MFVRANVQMPSETPLTSAKPRVVRHARTIVSLLAPLLLAFFLLPAAAFAQPAKKDEPAAAKTAPAPAAPGGAANSEADSEDVRINTPADWPSDPDMALTLTTNFRLTLGLKDAAEKVGAAAFIKPQVGAVYVEWLRTGVPIEKPAPMIRTILDRLRQEPKKAALGDDGAKRIEELDYKELKAGEVVEARLGWRHKDNETLTVSRTLIWQNKEKILRVVRASCVFAESDREKLQKVCQGSMVSLTSDEIDKGELLALGAVPGAASQASGATPDGAQSGSGSAKPPGPPGPTIGAPSSGVLYADANAKPEKSKTGRWIFVVGALLIIFAIYSLTRSRGGGGGGGGRSEDEDDSAEDEDDDSAEDDSSHDDSSQEDDEDDEDDDRVASQAEEE